MSRPIKILQTTVALVVITLLVEPGCSIVPRLSSRAAVCGYSDQGAELLAVDVKTNNNSITLSKLEPLMTLANANCPRQVDAEHGWFVAGAGTSGLGGVVFKLDLNNLSSQKWFELPDGDFVTDVVFSKNKGWRALTVGGEPKCKENVRGFAGECATANGVWYLVNDVGEYIQLFKPDPLPKCELVFDPTQRFLAYRESLFCVTPTDQNVSSQARVLDLGNRSLWTVPGEDQLMGPQWSSDGRWIAFDARSVSAHFTVQAIDTQSRRIHLLSQPRAGSEVTDCMIIGSNAWSPSGQKLVWSCSSFTGEAHGTLEVMDLNKDQGEQVASLATREWPSWEVNWAPDGKSFGWRGNDHNRLSFYDVETKGTRELTIENADNVTGPVWSQNGKALAFLRSADQRGYLDSAAWSNFNVATTVELPSWIKWHDPYKGQGLYWLK